MTHAGRSIIEMLFEQADILYAELMEALDNQVHPVEVIGSYISDGATELEEEPEEIAQSIADYWELRGKLGGLTYALAKMQNPYENTKTQMDAVKAELRERWEEE